MHLKMGFYVALGLLASGAADSWAVIYRCVDESDAVVLSNIKKSDPNLKCTKMDLPKASNLPVHSSSTKTPNADVVFGSEGLNSDKNLQRQKIIENEIALENKRLQDAKAKIAILSKKEGKAKPGSELELAEKERLLHEKNIDILKKELAR